MDNFFRYFYQDMGRVFRSLIEVFVAFFDFLYYTFNFKLRMDIIKAYDSDFSTTEWILMLVVNILFVALVVVMCILFAKLLRKIFRRYIPAKKYDEMVRQVRNLQRDLMRANYEKDKLLAMRMAELSGSSMPIDEAFDEASEEVSE